uniref:Cytochrome c oxidase assembly factor 1 homolog n=2 Tax=Sus scrofa TaxID=9823 RepID=A0A8D1LYQ6_PIG
GPPAGLRAPPAPRLPPDVREEPSRSPRRRGKPGGWHCPRRESGLGRRRSGCSCSPGGRDRVPGGLWPGESPPGSPPGCRRPPTSLRCKVGTCGPLVGSAPRDAVRCPLLCVSPWSCPGVSSSVPGSTFVKKWTWALCPWPQFTAARGGPCLDGCRKELFGSVVIIPFGPVTFEPHTGADHRRQLSFGDCQGRWAAKWQKGTRVLGPGSPPACPQVRQQSPGSRMSVPLGKLVFFSSVATSGTCTLLYFLIQKMFSRASYYQLALEHLHSHAEALEALGTPLSVHYLQLTDKYNFEDIADAQLKIPVSGPKSEGHLYVSSSREGPFRRWNLQEVFLELRDGHRIPVFKPSGEGPAR